jgi:hypothetical protein
VPATIGVVPSVLRNLTTIGEETVAVSVRSLQVAPPSVENWYLVIADPPFDAGAVTGTLICRFPRVGALSVGTPGATAVIAAVGDDQAVAFGDSPFIAVTSTRMKFPTKSIALAIKLEPVALEISEQTVAVSVAFVQLFHW